MTAVNKYVVRSWFAAILMLTLFLVPLSGHAEEPAECTSCHEALTTGKNVHAAISMGCASCHSAIDASEVPHKRSNKNPHGLASKMRDLCFTCHDKKPFMKTTVHGAIALGCTSCHNPHSSDHARLLKEDIPVLCLTCHKDQFETGKGKSHTLVSNEACSTCHNPHATDTSKLFVARPSDQSPNDHLLKQVAGRPGDKNGQ